MSNIKAVAYNGNIIGNYEYDNEDMFGTVMRDIVYLQEVIGCKLAMGDHRSSHPTRDEVIRLASDSLQPRLDCQIHIHYVMRRYSHDQIRVYLLCRDAVTDIVRDDKTVPRVDQHAL